MARTRSIPMSRILARPSGGDGGTDGAQDCGGGRDEFDDGTGGPPLRICIITRFHRSVSEGSGGVEEGGSGGSGEGGGGGWEGGGNGDWE